jgi:ribose-phosphate pyrophosphokinase
MQDLVIVGNVSDDPFAIDIGYLCGQMQEISDLISLKVYANSEFCPRFISDEHDFDNIGTCLDGKIAIICSTACALTRGALAMRTMILARAAKENGATRVILVEPDLYFSAQDRGPQRSDDEHGRSVEDLKKFDGQPFTAKLYAELLKLAGVDVVVTVHNHSAAVQELFSRQFEGEFHNLIPSELYADYLKHSDMLEPGDHGDNLVLCSPDKGAVPFVNSVYDAIGLANVSRIVMEKERIGERSVHMRLNPESDLSLDAIAGKDVIVLDDMVRTGSTIVECCRMLRQGNPRRVCFGVTHFLSGGEIRENLNSPFIDEILTLNTIPSILNRDEQGRLRKKIVVLKIERWIARFLMTYLGKGTDVVGTDLYSVDMSSKNPRWRPPTRY